MTDTQERLRIYNLLLNNWQWVEILRDAVRVEIEKERWYQEQGYGQFWGFEWYMVNTPVPTLNRMVTQKILDITLKTRSGTSFKIRNRDIVSEVLKMLEQAPPEPQTQQNGIPSDLFEPIVGYDDKKTLVLYALKADERVNMLFTGVPSSAKSLFLLELCRVPGSYYVMAPTLTGAGLAELLFAHEPRYLLIDEVDRINASDFGTLNSLMETGIVSETKWKKTRSTTLLTKVFAAGIHVRRLPSDFLSRFISLHFPPYTEQEFVTIGGRVLSTREGMAEEIARFISQRIWNMGEQFRDIRQCVYVARMSRGSGKVASEVLSLMGKQAGLSL